MASLCDQCMKNNPIDCGHRGSTVSECSDYESLRKMLKKSCVSEEADPVAEFRNALVELHWTLIKTLRIPAIVDWLARVLAKGEL